ncbi:MAG: ribonucleoside-diphosphate reductase subunit alpha [Methylococcaceae bacterium]|nr:ribonucleoside-diphosphate reductase subunit alpha [Methylococcaceae bacterium]
MEAESTARAASSPNITSHAADAPVELRPYAPGEVKVIRRNGKVTGFDASKINVAITKAFLAVEGGSAAASRRIHETVAELTDQVVRALFRRLPSGGTIHIEDIQDQVELALMRSEHQKVARSYVLYREEHARLRAEKEVEQQSTPEALHVTLADGSRKPLDTLRLQKIVQEACAGLANVDAGWILEETRRNLFDGVPEKDVAPSLVMTARTRIEQEPNYSQVSARLLLDSLRREALSFLGSGKGAATQSEMAEGYGEYFIDYVKRGVELELLSPELARYDLSRLTAALKPERDLQFTYLGLQTLYDRYFIHSRGQRFELPQAFFMRVAMGLAVAEIDREDRAIEFYQLLSSFDFMSSTPTLFNSGTLRPQLSSCYLTTVPDDLDGIYGAIKDNALLSKFAGGLGNDWTRVRGMGAHIKGTNGKSQGVVPFLKVANDTAVAVNQCLAPDTFVWTSEGIKSIKDIKVGDLVLGKEGKYCEVLQHMVYNQSEPMVEIQARHAAQSLKITAGHPIWSISVKRRYHGPKEIMAALESNDLRVEYCEAGKLRPGDFIAQTIPQELVPVHGLTEDDARFYGIMLGDGHVTKGDAEWGVSGNPEKDGFMSFVEDYLKARNVHYWISRRNNAYQQIKWSLGKGLLRDATTGQYVGGTGSALSFTKGDFYNEDGKKRIAPRFLHLPKPQTKALIRGLLETDGSVSGRKLLNFTNTSHELIEGLRYLLLRLGIPSAASYRERQNDHIGHRAEGSPVEFSGITKGYDLRIPCVPDFSEYFDYRVAKKQFWFEWQGALFTRIRKINSIIPTPFVFDLKVEGDHSYNTVVGAVSNGGKRKGAVCAYLETWHIDIEEFLDLRKNTGDDRRRTHDMNTANWVPDLFMKRVAEEGQWTLFSPNDVPDLHDLTGTAFEKSYLAYEEKVDRGEIALFKRIPALSLWRKMLSMLFETGHPWITFKDPCNLRSPQQHAGVVHSSNLCTEITLNTSDGEIAVCNLGSVNLAAHVIPSPSQGEGHSLTPSPSQGEGKGPKMVLDNAKLERTIGTAMRMLDNVIDINYYSVPQARRSNLRHRPVGLGIMGFQDALYKMRIAYTSEEALKFADKSMEMVSYHAIKASTDLAEERGRYSSFDGSLWSQGILPIDSIALVEQGRGGYLQMDRTTTLDWQVLRERVKTIGMRNSNTMAIAPTATISNIVGVSQSIEPTYQNLFVKSNLSGEFTVVNPFLVDDLKALGLWDAVMINDLKYYDGSVQPIERIPEDLKQLYSTAFEIDARWLVEAASRRQKWIDQGQSLNLYMSEPNGKKLDSLYKLAWVKGLKTTYYLRSMGATHVEKSTLSDGKLNKVQVDAIEERAPGANLDAHSAPAGQAAGKPRVNMCSIDNPECEACQ